MSTMHLKAVLAAALLGLLGAYANATYAGPLSGSQDTKDMTVYLGTMSVAELRKYPEALPEGHALPSGDNLRHVLIAIFDRTTGERITDAVVDAWVISSTYGTRKKRLHPEAIAGQVTYCNFLPMPPDDAYVIRVDIRRPGNQQVTTIKFQPSPAG